MTTTEIARQIVDELETAIKKYRVDGRPNPEARSIETGLMAAITAALDKERERGERYKKALEFYADQKNWTGYHRFVDVILNDSEIAKARSDDFDITLGGKRAREALRGNE